LKVLLDFLKDFYTRGNLRTLKIKKNVSVSFVIKGFSIVLGLIKVPLLLAYLDPEKYGVWLTIVSIITWIQHFDLGLGHGLRNKFAEAIAKENTSLAKGLVSTAYYSMTVLMTFILIITIPVILFLNWNNILNVNSINSDELKYTVLLTLIMFIIRFILHLITVILKADQKPALSDISLPIASAISLISIPFLKIFVEDSLFWASAIMSIPPVLVLLVMNIILFRKKYKSYKPTISFYSNNHLKYIYSLGFKFFLGQLLSLIMFSSSNFILANLINPEEVSIYNIARQYYGLPLTFYMIILTPYWSAITEAYIKNDFPWIKLNIKRLNYVAGLFTLGIILMLILSPIIFKIWIGERVIIPYKLSVIFSVYNVLILFLSPYTHFLNGVGKLNLGLVIGSFKIIFFLPVAFLLIKPMGASGLVVALILINSIPNMIFNPLQYKKIITNRASGIWNK